MWFASNLRLGRIGAESLPRGQPPDLKEVTTMATAASTSHVHALQTKHAGIEARLRDEMARPVPDAATVQYLKKRKLQLKEEITRS